MGSTVCSPKVSDGSVPRREGRLETVPCIPSLSGGWTVGLGSWQSLGHLTPARIGAAVHSTLALAICAWLFTSNCFLFGGLAEFQNCFISLILLCFVVVIYTLRFIKACLRIQKAKPASSYIVRTMGIHTINPSSLRARQI